MLIAGDISVVSDRSMATTDAPGDRVKALRKALSAKSGKLLTQKTMAERAGFPDDVYWTRVETNANKLTSGMMREAVSRAFGLSYDELMAFIDGVVGVDDVVAHLVDGAPLNVPRIRRSASLELLPPGIDVERLHAELRTVLERDLIPPEHRHAIPALLDISYREGASLTQAGWLDEAKKLAARLDAPPPEPSVADPSADAVRAKRLARKPR